MSLLVSCSNISKTFGAAPLFKDISLSVHAGDKIGLIGNNGSGKSSLLKILSRQLEPDEGEVSIRKETKLVYLAQFDNFPEGYSPEKYLLSVLHDNGMDDEDAYTKAHFWMGKAEFENTEMDIASLSGGWKKRLSIIAAMIQEPDLLLMDEPTNHLDMEGILWLEKIMQESEFAFVLVSHDRFFLENTTNYIIELGRQYPDGYFRSPGAYEQFLVRKEEFLAGQEQQQSVLANKVRRETEWLQRGPKARTSKARYRIDEAHRLKSELSEVKERNRQQNRVGLDFDGTERKTKRLLEVKNISKSLGGKALFDKLEFVLSPGTRIGLLGKNGSGKSTLMHLLNAQLTPDIGTIKTADGIQVVMFDQKREQLDQNQPLKRALAPSGDSVVYRGKSIHLVTWAKRFLFKPEQLELPVSRLSGGEQAKILLSRLMLQPADILMLDEPTNDLDIPSIQVLEDSLLDFPGAVVLVTHDRSLLDSVSTEILSLDEEKKGFFSDFHQWLNFKSEKTAPKENKPKPRAKKPGKLSYKDQRELDQMEELIQQAEEKVDECNQKIADPVVSSDADELAKWCDLLSIEQGKTEQLYARWEELEALKQSIEEGE